jgi:hypothetical protein
MVLINIQYWYKPKEAKGEPEEPEPEEGAIVNYITKIMKDRLWKSLIPHFTLPATETLEFAVALTRVNLTNVLDEGLRIGEIGCRMNSKVKLIKIGVCRK